MKADQRWSITWVVVAMDGIPDLPMELLQGCRFGMDRSSNSLRPKRTIVGLFHQKQNLVHTQTVFPQSDDLALFERVLTTKLRRAGPSLHQSINARHGRNPCRRSP